jgi:hypothetical protein
MTGDKRPGERPERLTLTWRRRPPRWERQKPTWREARPSVVAGALQAATARPTGNWYVLGGSRELRDRAVLGRTVEGHEVVAWRGRDEAVHAGPGACPHLGAPLRESPVHRGKLVCRWHGLALDGSPFAGWEPYPAHDDGVLVWVRLDGLGGEAPLPDPPVPERPAGRGVLDAVVTSEGTCRPEDVVANRLDPWHGAWLHPYSFADLAVEESGEDGFTLRVSFRLAGRLVVPVRAIFTAPGPRTVVMRITDGEGEGSVVETHATPLGADERGRARTAVIEAVLACSGRRGFTAARHAAPVVRPMMRAVAARLWRDDLAYAERRYALRAAGRFPG